MSEQLSNVIQDAWENRDSLPPDFVSKLKISLDTLFSHLESGTLRVATPLGNHQWEVHAWIKQALLLSFRFFQNEPIPGGFTQFYDKIPLQFSSYTQADFKQHGARIVPPACVRRGAYIAPKTILMPSYVNVGAYVGEGTLVDTWATIGSCAQIGKQCHISGGVGIGGVLEPLQAAPTIIEDNCFIGARSEIVEGVIIEEGAVISMGVFIGQSTKIYDRETGKIYTGRVPQGAVVVPGTLPSEDGKYSLSAAIIVKRVDEKTRNKVSLNELLRA